MREKHSEIFKQRLMMFVGLLVGLGLYFASRYNFLLFHTLAELFSITVAYGLFMIAWNSREFNENHYVAFLGIAYFFIASGDLAHTLAYAGMNIFPGYDANLPTQLWIGTRYFESLSLVMALRFLNRPLPARRMFGVYSLILTLLLVTTFTGIFPDCFRAGSGLTAFKLASEYVISAILLVALVMLLRKRAAFDPYILKLMTASIALTICSELAFTFYICVYGLSNLVGHYFKLLSFYLIYKAVIETGLREPYSLLFRDVQESHVHLQESEQKYRTLAESIPGMVHQFILHPDGSTSVPYINERIAEYAGMSAQAVMAEPTLLFAPVHPEDQAMVQEAIARLGPHAPGFLCGTSLD